MDFLVTESDTGAMNINSLPEEMILKIFGYLKQNQLGQIARVCRSWNELMKRPVLWKNVNVKFSLSHESQNTVTKSFIKTLPSCVSHIKLDFGLHYYWTEQLNFEELSVILHKRCPHLKMLFFNHAKLLDSLLSVTDLCTQFLQDVKVLVFRRSKFPRYTAKEEYDGISKIEVLDLSWCKFVHFNKPSFTKMPYLNQLHLSNTYVDDSWFQDDTSFLNRLQVLDLGDTNISSSAFQAIWNHGFNLKELYLCYIADLEDNDLNMNNSRFPYLITICLKCYRLTCEGIFSFIQSCPSLQNIYVKQEVADSYSAHPAIVHNRYKLEIVKVINCNDHVKNYLSNLI